MESGIHLTKNTLKYVAFQKLTWPSWHCNSFEIKLQEVKALAISPRMLFDNDLTFLLIISKTKEIYPIPLRTEITKGLNELEAYFELNSIFDEILKLRDEEFGTGIIDKIIFPKNYYRQSLFHHDWKLKIRSVYAPIWPKSFYGNMKIEVIT